MKLECTIADKTTLCESQISFVQDEKTYKIEHGRIQTFKGEKYTTLNENSIITFSDYKIHIPTDFFKTTEQEISIITKKWMILKDFEDMPDANKKKSCV